MNYTIDNIEVSDGEQIVLNHIIRDGITTKELLNLIENHGLELHNRQGWVYTLVESYPQCKEWLQSQSYLTGESRTRRGIVYRIDPAKIDPNSTI